MFRMAQTSVFYVTNLRSKEMTNMLAIIAAVLIVLWLAGFLAFHVTTTFIHVALIAGVVLLVMHFMRRSPARA
jgi:energy-converting hydrogenase Eha subunit G